MQNKHPIQHLKTTGIGMSFTCDCEKSGEPLPQMNPGDYSFLVAKCRPKAEANHVAGRNKLQGLLESVHCTNFGKNALIGKF